MSDIAAIKALADEYFRSLYEGDVAAIEKLYHPACTLVNVTPDGVATMSIPDYLEIVANRQSPKDAGVEPFGTVTGIEISGGATAVLRVDSAVQPRFFDDFLTLVKEQGQWKIAAKVYRQVNVA